MAELHAKIAEAIRLAAEQCDCRDECICDAVADLDIDCYLGSRTNVIIKGKPDTIAETAMTVVDPVLSGWMRRAQEAEAKLARVQQVPVHEGDDGTEPMEFMYAGDVLEAIETTAEGTTPALTEVGASDA